MQSSPALSVLKGACYREDGLSNQVLPSTTWDTDFFYIPFPLGAFKKSIVKWSKAVA